MNGAEQLKMWLEGTSVHNPDTDECCPDFSCCAPALQASDEERAQFCAAWANGDVPEMEHLLATFRQRGDIYAAGRASVERAPVEHTGTIQSM